MAKKVGKLGHNANYDFKSQKQPTTRMGEGDFANMPKEPMFLGFGADGATYRDGIINSFSCKVSDVSKIEENER